MKLTQLDENIEKSFSPEIRKIREFYFKKIIGGNEKW
jgi:hypothetical protein